MIVYPISKGFDGLGLHPKIIILDLKQTGILELRKILEQTGIKGL